MGLVDAVEGKSRILVERLAKAYPGSVTMERMIQALYADDPDGGPERADNAISVYNWRIRKVIEPLGWTIPRQNHGGANYRLVRLTQPQRGE
jgi:hypothetical protein